jgi:cell shape-determining protein MreD
VDLCIDLPYGQDRAAPLIGAHALGYTFGCFLLLQLRTMLFRGSALTLAVMTVLCAIASSLVVVFILGLHGQFEPQWAEARPTADLLRRVGNAVYSGVLALLLGPLLLWSMPVWAFLPAHQRLAARR